MTLKALFHGKTDSSAVQFLRSVVVSNIAFALDFGLCLAFVSLAKINYLLATVMSFTAGSTLNYFLSILWIFEENRSKRKVEFLAFLIISFAGLALNALGMFLLTGLLQIHYLVSRVVAATLVFFFNFACKKRLVFGELGLAHRPKRS
jgi:putative flippase GtrA